MVCTYLFDISVGEVIHEKVSSSQAEALVITGRKSLLQFLIIDQPASVLISHLEASHDARIRARRKCRRQKRRKRASVCWWRVGLGRRWCAVTITGRLIWVTGHVEKGERVLRVRD